MYLFPDPSSQQNFQDTLVGVFCQPEKKTAIDLPFWINIKIDHRADQMFLQVARAIFF